MQDREMSQANRAQLHLSLLAFTNIASNRLYNTKIPSRKIVPIEKSKKTVIREKIKIQDLKDKLKLFQNRSRMPKNCQDAFKSVNILKNKNLPKKKLIDLSLKDEKTDKNFDKSNFSTKKEIRKLIKPRSVSTNKLEKVEHKKSLEKLTNSTRKSDPLPKNTSKKISTITNQKETTISYNNKVEIKKQKDFEIPDLPLELKRKSFQKISNKPKPPRFSKETNQVPNYSNINKQNPRLIKKDQSKIYKQYKPVSGSSRIFYKKFSSPLSVNIKSTSTEEKIIIQNSFDRINQNNEKISIDILSLGKASFSSGNFSTFFDSEDQTISREIYNESKSIGLINEVKSFNDLQLNQSIIEVDDIELNNLNQDLTNSSKNFLNQNLNYYSNIEQDSSKLLDIVSENKVKKLSFNMQNIPYLDRFSKSSNQISKLQDSTNSSYLKSNFQKELSDIFEVSEFSESQHQTQDKFDEKSEYSSIFNSNTIKNSVEKFDSSISNSLLRYKNSKVIENKNDKAKKSNSYLLKSHLNFLPKSKNKTINFRSLETKDLNLNRSKKSQNSFESKIISKSDEKANLNNSNINLETNFSISSQNVLSENPQDFFQNEISYFENPLVTDYQKSNSFDDSNLVSHNDSLILISKLKASKPEIKTNFQIPKKSKDSSSSEKILKKSLQNSNLHAIQKENDLNPTKSIILSSDLKTSESTSKNESSLDNKEELEYKIEGTSIGYENYDLKLKSDQSLINSQINSNLHAIQKENDSTKSIILSSNLKTNESTSKNESSQYPNSGEISYKERSIDRSSITSQGLSREKVSNRLYSKIDLLTKKFEEPVRIEINPFNKFLVLNKTESNLEKNLSKVFPESLKKEEYVNRSIFQKNFNFKKSSKETLNQNKFGLVTNSNPDQVDLIQENQYPKTFTNNLNEEVLKNLRQDIKPDENDLKIQNNLKTISNLNTNQDFDLEHSRSHLLKSFKRNLSKSFRQMKKPILAKRSNSLNHDFNINKISQSSIANFESKNYQNQIEICDSEIKCNLSENEIKNVEQNFSTEKIKPVQLIEKNLPHQKELISSENPLENFDPPTKTNSIDFKKESCKNLSLNQKLSKNSVDSSSKILDVHLESESNKVLLFENSIFNKSNENIQNVKKEYFVKRNPLVDSAISYSSLDKKEELEYKIEGTSIGYENYDLKLKSEKSLINSSKSFESLKNSMGFLEVSEQKLNFNLSNNQFGNCLDSKNYSSTTQEGLNENFHVGERSISNKNQSTERFEESEYSRLSKNDLRSSFSDKDLSKQGKKLVESNSKVKIKSVSYDSVDSPELELEPMDIYCLLKYRIKHLLKNS